MTDRERADTLQRILSSIAPDKVPGPFICGAVGEAGPDGLHDAYMICPTYGADARCTAVFRRVTEGGSDD